MTASRHPLAGLRYDERAVRFTAGEANSKAVGPLTVSVFPQPRDRRTDPHVHRLTVFVDVPVPLWVRRLRWAFSAHGVVRLDGTGAAMLPPVPDGEHTLTLLSPSWWLAERRQAELRAAEWVAGTFPSPGISTVKELFRVSRTCSLTRRELGRRLAFGVFAPDEPERPVGVGRTDARGRLAVSPAAAGYRIRFVYWPTTAAEVAVLEMLGDEASARRLRRAKATGSAGDLAGKALAGVRTRGRTATVSVAPAERIAAVAAPLLVPEPVAVLPASANRRAIPWEYAVAACVGFCVLGAAADRWLGGKRTGAEMAEKVAELERQVAASANAKLGTKVGLEPITTAHGKSVADLILHHEKEIEAGSEHEISGIGKEAVNRAPPLKATVGKLIASIDPKLPQLDQQRLFVAGLRVALKILAE